MSRLATDLLRIFAAAFIVFNHGTWIFFNSLGTHYQSKFAWPVAAINQFGKGAVLFFIFLSGLAFSSHSVFSKADNVLYFYRQRLLRILPPYIFFSVIFGIFWYEGTGNIVIDFFTGETMYHLYFLPLISILYLLFPFLVRLHPEPGSIFLLGLFMFALDFAGNYVGDRGNSIASDWLLSLAYSLPAFVAGIWTGKKQHTINLSWWLLLLLFALAYGLVMLDFFYLMHSGLRPDPAGKIWRLSVFLYSGIWIVMFLKLPAMHSPATIRNLARATFLVYLIHPLFIRIAEAHQYNKNPFFLFGLYLSLSWIIVLAIQWLALRNRWIGLVFGEGDLYFRKHKSALQI